MRIGSTARPVRNVVGVQADVPTLSVIGSIAISIDPPSGAWVIDRVGRQQHLVRAAAARRRVVELETDVAAAGEDSWNSEAIPPLRLLD